MKIQKFSSEILWVLRSRFKCAHVYRHTRAQSPFWIHFSLDVKRAILVKFQDSALNGLSNDLVSLLKWSCFWGII